MKDQPKLVLASSSPFRKELLKKICPLFETASPNIDESSHVDETPRELSKRLAIEKAQALCSNFPNHLIIGSDQVAMLGDLQLTKPKTSENSVQQLLRSSGKVIHFYTSVCVLNSNTHEMMSDTDTCKVHMKTLSLQQIQHYVERDKPYGCAAAFKSEGLGIALFEKIEGNDPNALVGLPLIKLIHQLTQMGVQIL